MGKPSNSRLIIVTGHSGAGKTIAIRALEDLGFVCIDNLPLAMVEATLDYYLATYKTHLQLVLGLDLRSPNFASDFSKLCKKLEKKIQLECLFLRANEQVLAQRYATTRRRHPLLSIGGDLVVAIKREQVLLTNVEETCQQVMDTSNWTPHQLARQVEQYLSNEVRSLNLSIISFGFKHGLLKPYDEIFDVRFLRNPHFEPNLREMTGMDQPVRDYVFEDERATSLLERLVDLHQFLLPNYYQEGKHYFRLGIGCTGGKHRSVAMAEILALELAKLRLDNIYISVSHRDIDIKAKQA